MMKRKILLAIIAVFTMACSFQVFNDLAQKTPTTPAAISPTLISGTTETQADNLNPAMDQIEQQVIAIRGLQPKNAVQRALLNTDQLRKNVINDFFKDYTAEDAKDDVKELGLLGLIKPDFDINTFYIDLYSEQVAGYYDPKTKEMFVVSDSAFGGVEKMTYAHEYTHVLQDQTYDLENGMKMNDDYCKTHTEYCAAVQALTEGDASLSEQIWFTTDATSQEQREVLTFSQNYKSPVFDSAPDYMKQDFLFPYKQGLEFVMQLYSSGGWKAVDNAYKNPPVTTEQILHPEKYPSDKPVDVALPDYTTALGDGWREARRNVMGEWYLSLILEYGIDSKTRLSEDTATRAAAGWAGDSYLLYLNDSTNQTAFIMDTRWETTTDSSEFWFALQSYGQARWGTPSAKSANSMEWANTSDGWVRILFNTKDVIWVIAPDKSMVDLMVSQIP
jgi:hypothetical protein